MGVIVLVADGDGVLVEVAVGEPVGKGELVGRGVRLGRFAEVGHANASFATAVHVAGKGPTGVDSTAIGCRSEFMTNGGAEIMRVGTIGGFVWQPVNAISNIANGHRRPNIN